MSNLNAAGSPSGTAANRIRFVDWLTSALDGQLWALVAQFLLCALFVKTVKIADHSTASHHRIVLALHLAAREVRSSPLAFLISLAGALCAMHAAVWGRRRGARQQLPRVLTFLALVLSVAAVAIGLRCWPLSPRVALQELRFISVAYSDDFQAALVAAALTSALIVVSPTRFRKAVITWVIAPGYLLTALFTGLDLAQYLATGSTSVSQLLRYFLANVISLRSMLTDQATTQILLALFGPLVLCAATLWQRGVISARTRQLRPHLQRWAWGLLVALCLGTSLAADPDQPADLARLFGNVDLRLADDFLLRPLEHRWRGARYPSASAAPPLFDFGALQVGQGAARRANVVVVMLESARADSVSIYNPRLGNTPYLAALAAKSQVVEQMYAVVPRTSAAWMAVLGGVHPGTNSVVHTWLGMRPAQRLSASLPAVLRKNGYATGFFTPTELTFENEVAVVEALGFETIRSDPDFDHTGFERVNYFGYEDRILTQPILGWLETQRKDARPFLLTVMTNVGHHDYRTPKTWPTHRYESARNDEQSNYFNCLSYIDAWLADLMDKMAARGLLDNTIVVVLGDHGESFGEHGEREHIGVLFEEGIHIPALIYAPSLGIGAGRIVGLRQQIDVFPTLLGLLGYQYRPSALPGLPLFEPVPAERRLFFSGSLDDSYIALREGRMKFIYDYGRSPTLVYDLAADPLEQHTIGKAISSADLIAQEAEMLQWRDQVEFALRRDGARKVATQ